MKEKLQEYALIAEIISSVAILATLIILIIEMQENTSAIQAANVQSIAERTQQFSLAIMENEHSELYVKARFNPLSSLSPVEQQRLVATVVTILKIGEESYLQYQNGYLSEEYWKTRSSFVVGNLSEGARKEMYELLKNTGSFVSEYIDWLDHSFNDLEDTTVN